jgi:serine/threonine protein kinase
MTSIESCANDDLLHRYLRGDLATVEEDVVRRHLEECHNCRRRLEQQAGSNDCWRDAQALLADFTAPPETMSRTNEQQQAEAQADLLLAQVRPWLGPTDDPTKLGRVGPYEVLGIVGAGGAGIVLKAFDGRLNRLFALKVLLPSLTHHAAARRRFEREARAAAAVVHPNVVSIFAVDTFQGHPYLAMHYVGGRSLQQRLDAEGPLSPLETTRLAAQVARALAAAHAQGVIHRDIKPANILLEQTVDRAYVTDFGLARVADDASTHSGAIAGTPNYMSPEQCQGLPVDSRSDLFSLGSLIYAMCSGRPPFRAETVLGTLRKVCDSTPRNLRELQPETPEWLAGLVERLMEKSPERRLLSAAEVADILDQELLYTQNPTTSVVPPRPWLQRAPRGAISWKRPAAGLAGVAATIALLWGLGLAMRPADDAKQSGAPPASSAPTYALNDQGQPTYNSLEEKTFHAKDFDALQVFAGLGDVNLRGEQTDQIRVSFERVTTGVADAAAARALIDKYDLLVETAEKRLVLRSDEGAPKDLNADQSIRVAITVVVPEAMAAELATKRGTVTLTSLTRAVVATTDEGDIVVEKCNAKLFVTVRERGTIRLQHSSGSVIANSPTGQVELDDFQGTLLKATAAPSRPQ